MLPFYIDYSMFGFQRVGDAIWAAADQRSRGFLLGATSGRTTLGGEGLQHQDGSSHLVAATIPNCKSYDPAFACEMAIIVDQGMHEMLAEQQDVFYYITLMNENYAQPDLVAGSREHILQGMYLIADNTPDIEKVTATVTLLGSGAILREVMQAAQLLAQDGIASQVFSVTSWSELAREGQNCERASSQGNEHITPFVTTQLQNSKGPVIAATDYVRAVSESIRAYLPHERKYLTLGTDGFGRSDTRAHLRAFFQVDAQHIAKTARKALAQA
jgi:pyruvate dehydrogenase E1 component